jgi:hypothetical protein
MAADAEQTFSAMQAGMFSVWGAIAILPRWTDGVHPLALL